MRKQQCAMLSGSGGGRSRRRSFSAHDRKSASRPSSTDTVSVGGSAVAATRTAGTWSTTWLTEPN